MDKKGFTLIELLAVIVILAIIALIATPIVLNIINDAKSQSELRSADFYLDALELSIAQSTLKLDNITDGVYNIKDGNICKNVDCTETVPVEVKGEVPKNGSIYIKNGQIEDYSLVISDKTIIKNNKGEISYITKLEDICIHDTTNGVAEKTAGAKYTCRVKVGTSYNFYVLTTPKPTDETINLIMDQNINSDGTPAGRVAVMQGANANIYNILAWNNETGQKSNKYGPITAMNFLYNATKNWINIPALNYEYNDRIYQSIPDSDTEKGYISFVSNNGVLTISPLSGASTTIGTIEEPLRARMPIYTRNQINVPQNEVSDKTESNAYLYENLRANDVGPNGYWTLSSNANASLQACFTDYSNQIMILSVRNNVYVGVRPVITLKI